MYAVGQIFEIMIFFHGFFMDDYTKQLHLRRNVGLRAIKYHHCMHLFLCYTSLRQHKARREN